jgi:hypothetical protein
MSGYIQILRKGFFLDVSTISKPKVDYGFSVVFCPAYGEPVQIKVTVEGVFLACVFDGKKKACANCCLKQWRQIQA